MDAPAEAAPSCTPGALRCDGAILKKCASDASTFAPVVTCASATACDASLGRCTTCVPGDVACSSQQVTVCDTFGSAMVAKGSPCAAGTTCDTANGGRCDTCAPNQYACTG